MSADKTRAGPRKHGPQAATLGFSPGLGVGSRHARIRGAVARRRGLRAPYVIDRGLFRLFDLMFLVYVASVVALYLAGTLNRRWRLLGVVFGWVTGAWLLALAPLILVYTALIVLKIFRTSSRGHTVT